MSEMMADVFQVTAPVTGVTLSSMVAERPHQVMVPLGTAAAMHNNLLEQGCPLLNKGEDLSQVRSLSSSTPMRPNTVHATPPPGPIGTTGYSVFLTPHSPGEVCAGSIGITRPTEPIPMNDLDTKCFHSDSAISLEFTDFFQKPNLPCSVQSAASSGRGVRPRTPFDQHSSVLSAGECSMNSSDSGYTSSRNDQFSSILAEDLIESTSQDFVDGCVLPSKAAEITTCSIPEQKPLWNSKNDIINTGFAHNLLQSDFHELVTTKLQMALEAEELNAFSDVKPSPLLTSMDSRYDVTPLTVVKTIPEVVPRPSNESSSHPPFVDASLPQSPTKRLNCVIAKYCPGGLRALIGRKIGYGKLDIVAELSDRGMYHCVSCVLKYLTAPDLVRFAHVHRSWRRALDKDGVLKKQRTSFITKCRKAKNGKENMTYKLGSTTSTNQRAALSSITVNASQSEAAPLVAPGKSSPTKQTTRHDQYLLQARELVNEETLSKCPKCTGPAKVDAVARRGQCCQATCRNDYCLRCLSAFHGAVACYPTSPVKLGPGIGTRKAKRNLRRL